MDRVTDSRFTTLVELLRTRSLRAGSFTLASGQVSSYYIDARTTTMSAVGLELIGELALEVIRGAHWSVELVGGLTMGADPVAYAVARASRLSPPTIDAFSVRKEPKGHGTAHQIEGCFRAGASVVLVEDVITTGASLLKAVAVVRAAGGVISGVVAVVDRQEGGRTALEQAGLAVRVLVNAADLGVRT